jgi:hypothetical protein
MEGWAMADDAKFFYTNGAEMALSSYDVTIKFLRNGTGTSNIGDPAAAPGSVVQPMQPQVLDQLSVAMSLSHCKTMVSGMLEMLSAYEEQHGTIPLTSEAKQKWKAQISKAASKP